MLHPLSAPLRLHRTRRSSLPFPFLLHPFSLTRPLRSRFLSMPSLHHHPLYLRLIPSQLITLERTITNSARDNILDVLLKAGAIVKQEYDYKVRLLPSLSHSSRTDVCLSRSPLLPSPLTVAQVFKGILFSVPSADRGLTSWQAALTKQDGVKYVEPDQVVKVQ